MTDIFHTKIRQSLANPGLQAALDGNAERRQKARHAAFASLPEDLATMRRRANQVRAATIANLDQYLEQFISNARQNGMTVHRAADAEQARQIVLDIARSKGARLVAKSKTMIGEEIEINPALEAAGIEVVETDLGEYIVQLRDEPPAHIITPAVHLRRADIAATFQEKLGVPYNEDIPGMTETARRVLRETFLNADIGISGVNFGVAESGSLCLLTNEGNGRMVTTLPPVHIALMGIERLIATMDDLALMLYLLPRSATGQKITVYTNLIHAPRKHGEIDGPFERHVVLVDNGRSAISQSSLAEILYCIRCGACINACPVFREIGGHAYVGIHGEVTPYPGPIGSVVSPALFGQAEFGHLSRASSLCGACKDACPVIIDLPKLLLRVRAGGIASQASRIPQKGSALPEQKSTQSSPTHVPFNLNIGLRIFTWIATSPRRFHAIQRLAGIGSHLLPPFSSWIKIPSFTGWGTTRDFPRPATQPFRERFAQATKGTRSSDGVKPGAGSQPSPSHEAAPLPSFPHPQPPPSSIQRFEDELTKLGGNFIPCSEEDAAEYVIGLLRKRSITSIQAWESAYLPPDLIKRLQAAGIQVSHDPAESLKAGLTGAIFGVAETGTIIVPSGAGRPQTASLLPEIHIAVLQAADIYQSLPQALNKQDVQEASSVALISGPSRTADIEMTLTIGVHGPREVHVLCIK